MACDNDGRRMRIGRAALAAVSAAALALDGAPLYAQRRRVEPEANAEAAESPKTAGAGETLGGQPVGGAAVADDLDAAPEKAPAARTVPSVQIGASAAARGTSSSSTSPFETRVSVRVKGAPLATFLDTISAQAKVNFIITEGLEHKRVTAFLQNVTVREALQVLLEIKGLSYQQVGKSSTYIVTPRSKQIENLITRVYTLAYVPLIPLSTDDTADKEAQSQAGGAGGTVMGGGGGSKGCMAKNQKISVARILCSVLSKAGDIELEPRTNAIIVTDIPEVFPQVEQILSELDKKAPQVMIEAQIVEIDSNRATNLGFEWGGANGELATFTGGARETTFPLNLPRNLSNLHFFDPLSPTGVISTLGGASNTGSSTSGPTLYNNEFLLTSVLDLSQLKITLRALVQRSEARFLGKPKILTLNNKTAKIETTADEGVAVQSNLTGTSGGVSSAVTQTERVQTGVTLKVTPQVNKDGYITLLLQPSFADIQEAAISRTSNPVFNRVQRAATTLVRVKNGQTLVIGGLLRSTDTKVVRKVPLLGYIPIIGWLFTSVSSRRVNSDLVIFITPTIVND